MDLDYARFLLALVFIIGLIGLFALLLRRLGPAGMRLTPSRGKERRLGVVEVTALDARRRLVLIRRDDKEHLLLLGHSGDCVIERDIQPPSAARVARPDGERLAGASEGSGFAARLRALAGPRL